MKDLHSNIKPIQVLAPISISATQSALEVDLAGFGSAEILWLTGIEGGSLSGSLGWSVTLTHADDNGAGASGSYANVEAADVLGVTPSSGVVFLIDDPAEDEKLYRCGYVGGKRFIKLLITEIGSTSGMPQALVVIKGDPLDAPTSAN
jgi:hypothetical protein